MMMKVNSCMLNATRRDSNYPQGRSAVTWDQFIAGTDLKGADTQYEVLVIRTHVCCNTISARTQWLRGNTAELCTWQFEQMSRAHSYSLILRHTNHSQGSPRLVRSPSAPSPIWVCWSPKLHLRVLHIKPVNYVHHWGSSPFSFLLSRHYLTSMSSLTSSVSVTQNNGPPRLQQVLPTGLSCESHRRSLRYRCLYAILLFQPDSQWYIIILSYKCWSRSSISVQTIGTLVDIDRSIFGYSCCKGPDMVSGTAMNDGKAHNIVAFQGLTGLIYIVTCIWMTLYHDTDICEPCHTPWCRTHHAAGKWQKSTRTRLCIYESTCVRRTEQCN